MINKLKSTSGESIAETLVAVLIAAFALLMLAGSVNTSSNLITQSQSKLEEYYSKNNTLVEETTSTKGVIEVTVSGSGISEKWSGVPYYQLTNNESSVLGSKNLVSYRVPDTSSAGSQEEEQNEGQDGDLVDPG